jgi:hypothetical protein
MEWNVRLFANKEARHWIAESEPHVVWREDGRAVVQWKNHEGPVTLIVSAHHSVSFGPKRKPAAEVEEGGK